MIIIVFALLSLYRIIHIAIVEFAMMKLNVTFVCIIAIVMYSWIKIMKTYILYLNGEKCGMISLKIQ